MDHNEGIQTAYTLDEILGKAKQIWRKPNRIVVAQHTPDVRYLYDGLSGCIYEYLYLDDIWGLVSVTDRYLKELPSALSGDLASTYTDLINALDTEVEIRPEPPVITQQDREIEAYHTSMEQAFQRRLLDIAEQSRRCGFEPRDRNRFVIYKPGKQTVMVLDRSWQRLHHFDIRSDHYAWLGVESRWGFLKATTPMVKPDIEVGRVLAKILPVVMAHYETSKTSET